MSAYVDTSALAKWYLRERFSGRFEGWIRQSAEPTISSLTLVEMRCLLARRRRAGDLDAGGESRTYALFLEDIDHGYLVVRRVEDADVWAAVHLMSRIPTHALRALDAIHLTVCTRYAVNELATADAVMAAAAEELELNVVRFD